MDKSNLIDNNGRPLTQSLFLEVGYSDYAVFTFKDDDHEYKGKVYPSLKKIYLAEEDPTEYDFANNHLLGWNHWMRLCENKLIRKEIDEWREELEYKLRARGVKEMIRLAPESYQAAKWLADRGWATRAAGRPSKAEINNEKEFQSRIRNEYEGDVIRMFK